jgi:hypothetical protein
MGVQSRAGDTLDSAPSGPRIIPAETAAGSHADRRVARADNTGARQILVDDSQLADLAEVTWRTSSGVRPGLGSR